MTSCASQRLCSMDSLRVRRINAEWKLLAALAEANPDSFSAISREDDGVRIVMRQSPSWIATSGGPRVHTEHALRFVYPRFYPALPLEAYFAHPILHINVDPTTGFACLWHSYRPSQTIIDAILVIRSIISHGTANLDPIHRMRTDVLELPDELSELPMPTLMIPESCRISSFHPRSGRQRLGAELMASTTGE